MKTVFKLHYKKTLKRAMVIWKDFSHAVAHRVRLEHLTSMWLASRAKQGLFLAWKESLAKQHMEREEAVFKAWKTVLGGQTHDQYV